MKARFLVVFAISAISFCSGVLVSHHATKGIFDLDKLKVLKGVITDVQWMNPHAYMFLDVTTCKVDNYALELGSPPTMFRLGLDRNKLKPGTAVSVLTAPAKPSYATARQDLMSRAKAQHLGLGGCLTLPSGESIEFPDAPACPKPVKPIPEEGVLPGGAVR